MLFGPWKQLEVFSNEPLISRTSLLSPDSWLSQPGTSFDYYLGQCAGSRDNSRRCGDPPPLPTPQCHFNTGRGRLLAVELVMIKHWLGTLLTPETKQVTFPAELCSRLKQQTTRRLELSGAKVTAVASIRESSTVGRRRL